MLIEEEFKTIYLNYKIKEIVPFLKKLTPKDTKEVAAILKSNINKAWGHNTISVLAALACCTTKEQFEKLTPGYYSLPIERIEELFESYIPEWIGESYSFLHEVDYLKVLEWENKGYFALTDEISASLLSSSLLPADQLSSYPIILESHIWLLFEHECEVTVRSRDVNWKDTLKTLVQNGKIDRLRVLQSSLKAAHLNFSKDHNTWFVELFAYLNPSSQEILKVQEELFLIFHSTQPSLFSGVLKMLHPVIKEKEFKTEEFLQAVIPLAALSTKTVINPLLQAVENIAGIHKMYSEETCLLIMPVFLNKDKAIQIKAARIILTYGDPNSKKLREELSLYSESLLSDATELLDPFISKEEVKNKIEENMTGLPWHTSDTIVPIESIDDFIFFAPQVFNNHESYHVDLFLEALLRFNTQFKEEHIHQLEPAFKAALKLKDTVGLRHLLATFFINYGLLKQKNRSKVLSDARLAFPDLEKWVEKRTPLVFRGLHQLLSGVFDLLQQNKNLPLLSVPDHTPCWISVQNLVDKLSIYQEKKEQPIPFDLQIAILRVRKENLTEAEQYAKKKLNKDYIDFLIPVFDADYFKNHYRQMDLEGSFNYDFGYRKIHKWNRTEEVPQVLVNIETRKDLPENMPYLGYVFNSYPGIYDSNELIYILYTAPYFSGPLIAKRYNETLSSAVNQYDIKGNILFLDAWMKLNLPFQSIHYLFLSAGLLNKDKTFGDIAFEMLINRMTSEDFEVQELGKLIGKKISFEWAPVKRLTDRISGFINFSNHHNKTFEKLLMSILSAVEKPVFNLKKLLELYHELITLNQSEADVTLAAQLDNWGKENNLKKTIYQIKTNERKTL